MKKNHFAAYSAENSRGGGYNSLNTLSKFRPVLLFVFSVLFSFATFAQTTFTTSEGLSFTTLNDNSVVLNTINAQTYIAAHQSSPSEVIIPETVDYNGNNYKVTQVKGSALDGFTTISHIVFPSTLDSIVAPTASVLSLRTYGDGLVTEFQGNKPCAIAYNCNVLTLWFLQNAQTIKIPCVYDRKYNYSVDGKLDTIHHLTNYIYDIVALTNKFKSNVDPITVIEGVVYLEGRCFNSILTESDVFADSVTVKWDAHLVVDNNHCMKHSENTVFKVEKRLKVGEWNLVGIMQNGLTFQSLDNNKGETSNMAHDVYASKYDYNTNSWGDWAYAQDPMPGRGEAIMVWPTEHAVNGTADLGDEYIVLTESKKMNTDHFEVDNTNNGEGTKWFAYGNPYVASLSYSDLIDTYFLMDYFYNRFGDLSYTFGAWFGYDLPAITIPQWTSYFWKNSSVNQSGQIEPADYEEFVYSRSNYKQYTDTTSARYDVIGPATGFMMASRSGESRQVLGFNKNFLLNAIYNNNLIINYKSEPNMPQTESFLFTATTDKATKKLYAHKSEIAENGLDGEDSKIMYSVNQDAVNAYFSLEGESLIDNRFKELPYTCALNFHAQKDKEVAFALVEVPENVRVSLIDLANDGTETVLNLNEPVNISVSEGENEGRYLLKFGAMSSAINPIASAESTIEIYNNEDHIFISGKDLKSVEIVNTLGQTMQTEKISGEKAELYTKVPAGAYLVKAYNAKGESKLQKVVINR